VRTDSMAYNEKAHLMLPVDGSYNRFTAHCNSSETRFFITSSSSIGLRRMENFFLRVYRATSRITDETPIPAESFTITERRIRPPRFVFFPRFIRNIFDMPYVLGLQDIIYEVTLVSGRRYRKKNGYNYYIAIGTTDPSGIASAMGYVEDEIRQINSGTRSRLRIKPFKKLVDNRFSDPLSLMNIIRIPSERENPE
ncbi:MAG: hypothetical protein QXV22_03045, partial [Thermoplasmataceae archaeon]